jgi:hypothetical protein
VLILVKSLAIDLVLDAEAVTVAVLVKAAARLCVSLTRVVTVNELDKLAVASAIYEISSRRSLLKCHNSIVVSGSLSLCAVGIVIDDDVGSNPNVVPIWKLTSSK